MTTMAAQVKKWKSLFGYKEVLASHTYSHALNVTSFLGVLQYSSIIYRPLCQLHGKPNTLYETLEYI